MLTENNKILALRDNARNELLQIKSVEDGITYLNKLKSIEVWVKAEQKDAELQNIVAAQKIRTQHLLGELLAEAKRKGLLAAPVDNLKTGPEVTNGNHGKSNLSDYGLTKRQSATFQEISSIPKDKLEEFIHEKVEGVKEAVSELTTASAIRLARQLQSHEEEDETLREIHTTNLSQDSEITELAQYINNTFNQEQKALLISLIRD